MAIEGVRCSPLAPNHSQVGGERGNNMKSGTNLQIHSKSVSEKDTQNYKESIVHW